MVVAVGCRIIPPPKVPVGVAVAVAVLVGVDLGVLVLLGESVRV